MSSEICWQLPRGRQGLPLSYRHPSRCLSIRIINKILPRSAPLGCGGCTRHGPRLSQVWPLFAFFRFFLRKLKQKGKMSLPHEEAQSVSARQPSEICGVLFFLPVKGGEKKNKQKKSVTSGHLLLGNFPASARPAAPRARRARRDARRLSAGHQRRSASPGLRHGSAQCPDRQ